MARNRKRRKKKRSVKSRGIFDKLKGLYGSVTGSIKKPKKQKKKKGHKEYNSTKELENDGWVLGEDGLWRKPTSTGQMIRANKPSSYKKTSNVPYNKFTIGNRDKAAEDDDDDDDYKVEYGWNKNNNQYYNRYNRGTSYGTSYSYSTNYNRSNYNYSYRSEPEKMASNLESLQSGEAICSVYFAVLPDDATKGISAAFKVLSSISKSMISDSSISLDIKTRNEDELRSLIGKCEYSVALNQTMFIEHTDLGKAIDIFLGNGILEFSQILYRDDEFEHSAKLRTAIDDNPFTHLIYECLEYNRVRELLKNNFSGFYSFAEKRIEDQTAKLKKALHGEEWEADETKKIKNAINTISYHVRLSEEIPMDVVDDATPELQVIYNNVNESNKKPPVSAQESLEKAIQITKDSISFNEHLKNDMQAKKDILREFQKAVEEIKEVMGSTTRILPSSGKQKFRNLTSSEGGAVDIMSGIDSNASIRREIESGYSKLFELPVSTAHDVYLTYADVQEESYKSNYVKIAPYISSLKKQLRLKTNTRVQNLKGQRNGRFDDSKIAEAVQGINSVYTKRYKTVSNHLNFGLLVDESGSMDGHKISMAKRVAILFVEALQDIKNINLNVYGHTADRTNGQSCDMIIYKERGKKFNKYVMGGIRARGNNRDGVAIQEVCERMLKFNGGPGIVILVADGAPSARRYEGHSHTRDTVRKYEKMGFDIISISIDSYYDPSSMFSSYVKFTNMDSLAKDVGTLLKKLVSKHLKQTTLQV
jgi:hypothetical protein